MVWDCSLLYQLHFTMLSCLLAKNISILTQFLFLKLCMEYHFFNLFNILGVHNSSVATWNEGVNGWPMVCSIWNWYIISINGKYQFKCEIDIVCQNLYYFIFKTITIVLIIILFFILAKCYRLRIRENEVNLHVIAEEHYERYIEQDQDHRREIKQSSENSYLSWHYLIQTFCLQKTGNNMHICRICL